MKKDFEKELDELFDRDNLLTKEVEVIADADCSLYCDGEFMSDLNAGVSKTVRVSAGKHEFIFKTIEGRKRTRSVEIGDTPVHISVEGLITLPPQPVVYVPKLDQDRTAPTPKIDKSTSINRTYTGTSWNNDDINSLLIVCDFLSLLAGIILFILALTCSTGSIRTSFNRFGWVGFAFLLVSFIISLICMIRGVVKPFTIFSLILSLLAGFICLYDSVDEFNKVVVPVRLDLDHFTSRTGFDDYTVLSGANTVTYRWNNFRSVAKTYPFAMPKTVYLQKQPSFFSQLCQPNNQISIVKGNVSPYYSINGNELTIYNLAQKSSYEVCFEYDDVSLSYGLVNSFEYQGKPSNRYTYFTTTN